MSLSINDDDRDAPRNIAHLLRTICVYTFVPALCFNIAHGAEYGVLLPALGLIPHAFSVGLAVYELGWWKKLRGHPQYTIILQESHEDDKPSLTQSLIVPLFDTLIGLSLLTCIVGAYIIMVSTANSYWYFNVGLSIVGTWATLPYIVNALIHGFFLLKALYELSKRVSTPKRPTACAHCAHCRAALHGGSPPSPPVAESARQTV